MLEELSKDRSNVIITSFKGNPEETCGRPAEKMNSSDVSEGGWGYVVVFAFSVILILLQGLSNSFGILFHDFLNKHNDDQHSIVIFMISMNMGIAVSGIGSFMTNIALKWFTIRQTALFGALIVLSGDIFAVFMTAPFHLVITYGILKGLGLGVLLSLGFLVLNSYFVIKRTSMTSLAQTSVSVGGMIFPATITALLEYYGFRGCMLIILAMDLHLIFAALLLVPAKPITRPVRVERKNRRDIESLSKEEHDETFKSLLKTNESIPILKSNKEIGKTEQHKEGLWLRTARFLNLNFLADPIFVNIIVGMSLSFFADANFKFIEPLLLYSYSLKKSQVAVCITVGGVADFLSRILMAIVTLYMKINLRFLYFILMSLSCVSRLVFLVSENYVFLTVMTGLIGLIRSWIAVLYSLIIANYVTLDKFPAAYGLLVVITGLTMAIGGPLTGIIHTVTGEYEYVVYTLAFCNSINIITWMVEYFCTKKHENTKHLPKK